MHVTQLSEVANATTTFNLEACVLAVATCLLRQLIQLRLFFILFAYIAFATHFLAPTLHILHWMEAPRNAQ